MAKLTQYQKLVIRNRLNSYEHQLVQLELHGTVKGYEGISAEVVKAELNRNIARDRATLGLK